MVHVRTPMRSATILVLLVLFGFGLALTAQDKAATAPDSPGSVQAELRSVVEQYLAAYQKKDLEAMMALWSAQSPSLASVRQETEAFFAANENIHVTKIVVSEAVFGEPAKVRVKVSSEASATDVNTRVATTGIGHEVHLFTLLKESDKWKLWQDTDAAVGLAAELVAMASEQERAALLKKEEESISPGLIKALLENGTKSTNNGEFGKASEICSLAGKLAEEI